MLEPEAQPLGADHPRTDSAKNNSFRASKSALIRYTAQGLTGAGKWPVGAPQAAPAPGDSLAWAASHIPLGLYTAAPLSGSVASTGWQTGRFRSAQNQRVCRPAHPGMWARGLEHAEQCGTIGV